MNRVRQSRSFVPLAPRKTRRRLSETPPCINLRVSCNAGNAGQRQPHRPAAARDRSYSCQTRVVRENRRRPRPNPAPALERIQGLHSRASVWRVTRPIGSWPGGLIADRKSGRCENRVLRHLRPFSLPLYNRTVVPANSTALPSLRALAGNLVRAIPT